MEGSIKDLSQYRFSCAKENLEASKALIQVGQFKSSVNWSYYDEILAALSDKKEE